MSSCPNPTDTCAIDYPTLGTAIATGTGSATYTWNTTKEGIGTYSSFYAVDGTQNTNSTPQSLTTYVPFVFYNITNGVTQTLNIGVANASINTFYPYKLYAPHNGINYTLTQIYNSVSTILTNNALNISYIPPPSQPSPAINCPVNYIGGEACIGNITYTSNATLTGNITATGNIKINSGVYLTTDGFYIISGGIFNNYGTIEAGTHGTGYAYNVPNSYGGSGGGGSNLGQAGGNTLVPGGAAGPSDGNGAPGSTPSAPTVTNTAIKTWSANFTAYLSGAGGGASATNDGGNGAYGVYIQAYAINAGIINTAGQAGKVNAPNAGGGGGGGVIVLAYGAGGYTAGTYTYSGGAGGGSTYSGGAGGNGQVVTYPYSTPPLSLPIYKYVLKEQSGSRSLNITLTLGVSMTDINSAFNFSSQLQYFPILAHTPIWTAKPSSWSIIVANEPITNQQHTNTSLGAQFDSPNLQVSFANAIKLNYPFTSFYLNLTDNPKVQSSLTLSPFKFTLANSIISSLRNIANFSIFSQYTFNGIPAVNATMKLLGTINSYSFNSVISNNTDTNGYIPKR